MASSDKSALQWDSHMLHHQLWPEQDPLALGFTISNTFVGNKTLDEHPKAIKCERSPEEEGFNTAFAARRQTCAK